MINMSARVLPKEAASSAQVVRWPSVTAIAAKETADPGTDKPGSSDPHAMELSAHIAVLENELSQAKIEREEQVRNAIIKGRQEGQTAAREAAAKEFQAELEKLGRLMNSLAASAASLRRQAEEDIVRLAIAIARRILHREILVDSEALFGLVKAALSRIDQREIHQIRTHPQTVRLLEEALRQTNNGRRIEISADSRLDRGALIVETAKGQLDASVETQLDEIERGFTDLIGKNG
jgi:flagellar assembly protein FliH